MKKIFFIAAAMIVVSCSVVVIEEKNETTQLSVKLSGVVNTLALSSPGSTAANTIQISNGHIFVIDRLDSVPHHEELNIAKATGTGQTLTASVATDSRVFIVCNLPPDFPAPHSLDSLNKIKSLTSAITHQTDYTKIVLANSDGQPAAIGNPVSGVALVNVSIKPLISRMELVRVVGEPSIKAFTVTGVFVDNYYPSFTFSGGKSGTMFAQGQSTTFNGIGDTDICVATGSFSLVAAPPGGKVWAHNVASGSLPRFIIRLTGVKYDIGSGVVDLSANTYYLTVTGYNLPGLTGFERGKIYQIGGPNGIYFTRTDLGATPNAVNINIAMELKTEEWVLESLYPNL